MDGGSRDQGGSFPNFGGFEPTFFDQLRNLMDMFSGNSRGRGSPDGFGRDYRLTLDERHFRRVDRYSGDSSKFRGWYFDLLVAIGQIDRDLRNNVETLVRWGNLQGSSSADQWSPDQGGLDPRVHAKYQGELFGVLVSLTDG